MMNLTELLASKSPIHDFKQFEGSEESQATEYDLSRYTLVCDVLIMLQTPRYLLLVLALRYRAVRRLVHGS